LPHLECRQFSTPVSSTFFTVPFSERLSRIKSLIHVFKHTAGDDYLLSERTNAFPYKPFRWIRWQINNEERPSGVGIVTIAECYSELRKALMKIGLTTMCIPSLYEETKSFGKFSFGLSVERDQSRILHFQGESTILNNRFQLEYESVTAVDAADPVVLLSYIFADMVVDIRGNSLELFR
jgi:hypothetical protein